MRKLFFALSILAFAISIYAQPVKVAYIGAKSGSAQDCAIFNGIRDAFKELENRYGKTFELEFVCSDNPDIQIKEIGKFYIGEQKGIILFPANDSKIFKHKIDEFSEKKFPIALVGRDIPDSKRLCYVGGDEDNLQSTIASELKRLSKNVKPQIFVYVKESSGDVDVAKKSLSQYWKNLFVKNLLNEISIDGTVHIEFAQLYSIYSAINNISILRRDNYAEVFADVELLSDTFPIKKDSDRLFALAIGAAPYLAHYLEAGELSSCIHHDYYGWGYFAARTLAEKIIDNTEPSLPVRKLKVLRFTQYDSENFKRDWHNWTK